MADLPSVSLLLPATATPLIIDGTDIVDPESIHFYRPESYNYGQAASGYFQGANASLCEAAAESSARAFPAWSSTPARERRRLFLKLALVLRENGTAIRTVIEEEIQASAIWSHINLQDSIGMIEEAAPLATSSSLHGLIPPIQDAEAQALVFKEPLGVVLGIAPWNSPLILGFRAVVAAVVAGNTAILKGSELSPRTHYIVAKAFQLAGFPPGVVNFLLHRPQDAKETFRTLVTHPEVRKCNFTGSTAVGRQIAAEAGRALKPVLLELGGKNFAVVLDDADLDQAAEEVFEGAFLNSGQICMSTDLCLVTPLIFASFRQKVGALLSSFAGSSQPVITAQSQARISCLVSDAISKGAQIMDAPQESQSHRTAYPATVLTGVTSSMNFFSTESFGPVLGLVEVKDLDDALRIVKECPYGLSLSVFTKNHFAVLKAARAVRVGAVHINSSTVHDEATLPHGGHQDSGWGRFGASWGIEEFLQTKTIMIHT